MIKNLGVLSSNNSATKSSKLAKEISAISELIFESKLKNPEKNSEQNLKFYRFLTSYLMLKFNKNIYNSSGSNEMTGDMLVYFLN